VIAIAMESEAVLRSCRPGRPDVLVLDTTLPGDNTSALLRRVRQKGCDASVVLFGDWTPETAGAARRLECNALVSLYDTTDTFVRSVHYAAEGDTFMSDRVLGLLQIFDTDPETPGSRIERLLTPTERQILRSLAEGGTSKDIARDMFISYRTVQKHRNNIAHKLGLEGPNALMAFAMRHYSGRR